MDKYQEKASRMVELLVIGEIMEKHSPENRDKIVSCIASALRVAATEAARKAQVVEHSIAWLSFDIDHHSDDGHPIIKGVSIGEPNFVMLHDGRVVKVNGTVCLSGDGEFLAYDADVWRVFPGDTVARRFSTGRLLALSPRGQDDEVKTFISQYAPASSLFSTKEAAEAAAKENL